ncbi:MAG: BolA family transcriptional regulator [Rhodocyclaceae bacterium]
MTPVERELRRRLAALAPASIELADESARHAGHAGSRGGAHFRLRIVSEAFSGRSTLERHRLIHDALGELMRRDIHALSIAAFAPQEIPSTEKESHR